MNLNPNNIYTCPWCGNRVLGTQIVSVVQRNLPCHVLGSCNSCCNWIELSLNRPEGMEVMDGVCFIPRILPFGEKCTAYNIIIANDRTGRVIRFFEYDKYYGKPPQTLKHLFPDTLIAIPEKAFRPKRGLPNKCTKRGCLNRNFCYWYDISSELTPFNEIPEDYIPGTEQCPSFFNKSIIKTEW